MMHVFPFFFLIVFSGQFVCRCNDIYNNSRCLYQYLFESKRHHPSIVPRFAEMDPVNVKKDTVIRELVELNEKFQILRVKIWVRLQWRDCSLVWSPNDFGGQESIIVPYNTLWMPDLAIYEGSSDEANMPDMKEYRASVKHDVSVRYNFPTIVTLACRIDVTNFPYDQQNCSLTFSSWMYSESFLHLQSSSSESFLHLQSSSSSGDTDYFIPHNEWQLISMKAQNATRYYSCCKMPYSNVIFYLVLARHPKLYLLTLSLPCKIVSLLSMLGYLLPPVSGEKISLRISVLLTTIVVFMILVQDRLPSSSDTFPYVGIYLSMLMLSVCLSCVMSGVVMYVYYNGSTKESMSRWVHKLFLTGLCRVLFVSKSHHKNEQVVLNQIKPHPERQLLKTSKSFHKDSNANSNGQRMSIPCSDISHHVDENDDEVDNRNERNKSLITNDWELLAYVLDRLFLLFYATFTVVNINIFFVFIFREM